MDQKLKAMAVLTEKPIQFRAQTWWLFKVPEDPIPSSGTARSWYKHT